MAYEDKYRPAEMSHNIIMEERAKLSVSGVSEVESFDEGLIVMNTEKGTLFIKGSELHVEKLSLDSGEVMIEGHIDGLDYEDAAPAGEGFFSRIFK